MSQFIKKLENKIRGKINAIANETMTVQEAGVNSLLTSLKGYDEASAEELQKKYIETVKKLNQKKD